MSVTDRQAIPLLSKSRFMAGLQCHKRLFLECFHRELAEQVDAQQQAIFDTGTGVGELARRLYPGGLLIEEDHLHHTESVYTTLSALTRTDVPAIFEAGFLYDGIRIRADILVRAGDGLYDLIEVKSTSKMKEEHVFDVGIQLYVLLGCGLHVQQAYVCHLNSDYTYEGGDYALSELFHLEHVTAEALQVQPDIPALLETMREPLWSPEPPDIRTGRHCSKPYRCLFYTHCHENEPAHHVSQFPWAREKLLKSLQQAGIDDIRNVPAAFPGLNHLQRRVRDCVVNDRFFLSSDLRQTLSALDYPIYFLDFETFNPALPLYVGTRPYQQIPFQWSAHALEANGELTHAEFLHEGDGDPREPFARSLVSTLGDAGSVVVYSSFEASRLSELADMLPGLAPRLLALRDGRLVDLLQLVRAHCYHPAFHGSFSIKSVLPALVPHLGYDDLEIADGTVASVAYAEMIQPETPPDRKAAVREALLAYCERDTLAEVELFRFFTG